MMHRCARRPPIGGRLASRVVTSEARSTIYTEAMEVFHRAADLIGLDRRVRMELEEPDYEHIFYVTVKLHTRLAPLTAGADRFKDLAVEQRLQPVRKQLAVGKEIGRAHV